MKIFIVLFLILSCSKEQKAPLLEEGKITETRQYLQENIQGDLDLFVGFYWPKNLKEDENSIVESIIKDSREITRRKDKYFKEKSAVKCNYQAASCDCLLNEICAPDEVPDTRNYDHCESIREELDEIEMGIIEIAILIESLKSKLNDFKSPGEWLETHLDHTNINKLPYINLQDQTFTIPALGGEEVSYSTEKGEIFNFIYQDPTLTFSFYEKRVVNQKIEFTGNIVDAKVDLLNKNYVYQFMGELEKIEDGEIRRGIFYFELPKPEKSCSKQSL